MMGIVTKVNAQGFGIIEGADGFKVPFILSDVMSHHVANWSYEKEIRFFTTLKDQSDGLYFKEFGEDLSLTEVVAGARCKLTRNEILEALRPLNNVKLIEARPGFQRFEIVEDQRGFE